MTVLNARVKPSPRDIFVGRERELALLKSAAERATAAEGGLVLISGEPGIGKTRLTMEFARQSAASGFLVIWGRTPETEGAPALWPWSRLLGSLAEALPSPTTPLLAERAEDLAQVFPGLVPGHGSATTVPAAESAAARFRGFEAATALVRAASTVTPLLLILEDLHWADEATLQMLAHAAPAFADVPVLLLATYREADAAPALQGAIASAGRLPHAREVRLAGLSVTEVGEFAAALGARTATASDLHARTDGNPLFLAELAMLEASGTHDGLPETVKAVFRTRLNSIGPAARALLQAAAIAGRSFHLHVAATAAGIAEEAAADLLDAATTLHLVDAGETPATYQFRHALMREAIEEEIPPARRARLHGAVARAFEAEASRDEELASEIARHYTEAAITAETAAKAYDWQVTAARQAAARFAWDRAIAHYEAALRLLGPAGRTADDEIDILFALGRCQEHSTKRQAAISTTQRLIAIFEARSDALGLARALAGFSETGLEPARELALMRFALDGLEPSQVELRVKLLCRAIRQVDVHPDPAAWLAEASRLVDRNGLANLEAEVVAAQAAYQVVGLGDHERGLQLYRHAADIHRTRGAHGAAANMLYSINACIVARGRRAEIADYAQACRLASQQYHNDQLWNVGWLSERSLAMGDGQFEPLPADDERFYPYAIINAITAIFRGDLDFASEVIENYRWPPATDHFRRPMRAWVAILRGHHKFAVAEWRRYRDFLNARSGFFRLNTPPTFAQLELMALYTDADCEELLDARFDQTRSTQGMHSVDCARGLAALKLGRLDLAEQHFRTGEAWAREQDFPVQLGRNLLGLALVAEAREVADAAFPLLSEADALFRRCGAMLFAGNVAEVRERLGPPSPALGLSKRELDVVQLIVGGATNQAIASALVITTATAATHVSHILTKLDLKNRTEIAAWAMRNLQDRSAT